MNHMAEANSDMDHTSDEQRRSHSQLQLDIFFNKNLTDKAD